MPQTWTFSPAITINCGGCGVCLHVYTLHIITSHVHWCEHTRECVPACLLGDNLGDTITLQARLLSQNVACLHRYDQTIRCATPLITDTCMRASLHRCRVACMCEYIGQLHMQSINTTLHALQQIITNLSLSSSSLSIWLSNSGRKNTWRDFTRSRASRSFNFQL